MLVVNGHETYGSGASGRAEADLELCEYAGTSCKSMEFSSMRSSCWIEHTQERTAAAEADVNAGTVKPSSGALERTWVP